MSESERDATAWLRRVKAQAAQGNLQAIALLAENFPSHFNAEGMTPKAKETLALVRDVRRRAMEREREACARMLETTFAAAIRARS
jgi:hypothetical protein